ncbi:hypothetical protein E2C01_009069 [Portunus trituberculatus]|uniref:Uncharacterized protein n=1 Tax=Portunus trituberculatus TaxID=210409 RepID=A0A5B7D3Y1_PORTR|nr:hypothetical protein [Portunus trituberculatus]
MVPYSSQPSKTIERKILKPGAVPSQFSWTQPLSPSVKARMKRAQKKERSGNVSQKLILCHSKDDFDVGAEFEVGATVLMDDCGKTSETALAL